MRQGVANENGQGGEGFAFVGTADGEFTGILMTGVQADEGEHAFDIGAGAGAPVGEGDAGEVAARDGFEQAGGTGVQAVGQRESKLEREGHQEFLNLAQAGPMVAIRFMGKRGGWRQKSVSSWWRDSAGVLSADKGKNAAGSFAGPIQPADSA